MATMLFLVYGQHSFAFCMLESSTSAKNVQSQFGDVHLVDVFRVDVEKLREEVDVFDWHSTRWYSLPQCVLQSLLRKLLVLVTQTDQVSIKLQHTMQALVILFIVGWNTLTSSPLNN